ncbi:unnamed protein product [Peniophora sp. CBMAI 1063]|nr:unnamed protein product [Peniophora sp. CBMAI 1063]
MEESARPDQSASSLRIIENHAFSLMLETSLYIVYIALVLYLVLSLCLNRRTRTLPTAVLLYTLLMFGIFSAYWILDVYFLWAEFHSFFLHMSGSADFHLSTDVHWKGASWINQDGLLMQYFAPVYAQYIVQLILILLGDFVSLWRAYTIFGRPKWLLALASFTAFVESVVYVLIFASSSAQYLSPAGSLTGSAKALGDARTPLTFLGYALTGIAQLSSTAFIAYKAWIHWQVVREFMDGSSRRRTFGALAIIIESGVIYVVLLTWYGAITYFGSSSSLLVYTCRFYSAPLIAMYPTLVVVLVASRRSVLDRSIVSATLTENTPRRFSPTLVDRRHVSRGSVHEHAHSSELGSLPGIDTNEKLAV